jgi:hypothetical protein
VTVITGSPGQNSTQEGFLTPRTPFGMTWSVCGSFTDRVSDARLKRTLAEGVPKSANLGSVADGDPVLIGVDARRQRGGGYDPAVWGGGF